MSRAWKNNTEQNEHFFISPPPPPHLQVHLRRLTIIKRRPPEFWALLTSKDDVTLSCGPSRWKLGAMATLFVWMRAIIVYSERYRESTRTPTIALVVTKALNEGHDGLPLSLSIEEGPLEHFGKREWREWIRCSFPLEQLEDQRNNWCWTVSEVHINVKKYFKGQKPE